MNWIPSALHPYKKKKKRGSYRIKLGPNLLRLVRLLGLDKSKVGGREQFDSLFLKPNQIKHLGFCGRCQVGSLGVDTVLIFDFASHTLFLRWLLDKAMITCAASWVLSLH